MITNRTYRIMKNMLVVFAGRLVVNDGKWMLIWCECGTVHTKDNSY